VVVCWLPNARQLCLLESCVLPLTAVTRKIPGHIVTSLKENIVEDYDTKRRAESKAALEKIKNGLATKVRILVPANACPACRAIEGAYAFDDVPEIPPEGCSCLNGCQAYYAPVLDRFGP